MKQSRGARRDNLYNNFFLCPSALTLMCMKSFNLSAYKLSLYQSLRAESGKWLFGNLLSCPSIQTQTSPNWPSVLHCCMLWLLQSCRFQLLRQESPSGMCAKLHTVAASNNRDHSPRSLYYCLFAPDIYGCCSSRTSRSWWTAHLTQRQQRGCNIANSAV